MGRLLVKAVAERKGCELAAALEGGGSPHLGENLGEIKITDDLQKFFQSAEAVIDFSLPAATAKLATLAAEHGRPLVLGTTGIDNAAEKTLSDMACRIPILVSPNMSKGIRLMRKLVALAARTVDWDAEALDIHHKAKRDAPSGTAIALGEEIAAARDNPSPPPTTRSGPRKEGEIGYASIRGGDVVGEHSVEFIGKGERLVIKHIATDRAIYAEGAVEALLWLAGKPPGLYAIDDCFA